MKCHLYEYNLHYRPTTSFLTWNSPQQWFSLSIAWLVLFFHHSTLLFLSQTNMKNCPKKALKYPFLLMQAWLTDYPKSGCTQPILSLIVWVDLSHLPLLHHFNISLIFLREQTLKWNGWININGWPLGPLVIPLSFGIIAPSLLLSRLYHNQWFIFINYFNIQFTYLIPQPCKSIRAISLNHIGSLT